MIEYADILKTTPELFLIKFILTKSDEERGNRENCFSFKFDSQMSAVNCKMARLFMAGKKS